MGESVTSYQLLQMLPDAREAAEDGRSEVLRDVLDEIDVDVVHVRFVTRRRPYHPGQYDPRDDYDYEEYGGGPSLTPEEIEEYKHGEHVRRALEHKRTDWAAWRNPSTISSLTEIYRKLYSEPTAASIASVMSAPGFFARLTKP